MIKVTLQPYGSVVYFFNNEPEMRRVLKRRGEELAESLRGITYQFQAGPGPKDKRHYMIGVFDGNAATLVHECGHLTLDECVYRGFSPETAQGEPFCYLIDYLFGQLLPHIKGKKNR